MLRYREPSRPSRKAPGPLQHLQRRSQARKGCQSLERETIVANGAETIFSASAGSVVANGAETPRRHPCG